MNASDPEIALLQLRRHQSAVVTMDLGLPPDPDSVSEVFKLLEQMLDIEPGVHNLRLQGVLGKDVYDRDLIFDDHTRTELVWQRKELRLGQVTKLDPNRPPPPEGEADGMLPIAPEHPTAPEPPAPAEVLIERPEGKAKGQAPNTDHGNGRRVVAKSVSLNPLVVPAFGDGAQIC